jgi:hypothetical protein
MSEEIAKELEGSGLTGEELEAEIERRAHQKIKEYNRGVDERNNNRPRPAVSKTSPCDFCKKEIGVDIVHGGGICLPQSLRNGSFSSLLH